MSRSGVQLDRPSLGSVTSSNPRHSKGVAGVCSDQEAIMSQLALVHAAPTWMDDVLADSFPASDPPSWTPGMARPAPMTVHVDPESPMLQTGDLVPHFTVTTFGGGSFDYSDIWQRKNLVLVLLPQAASPATTKFVDQLTAQISEVTGDDSACVITRDSVSGVPSPGIIVADRWGEIHYVAAGTTVDDLPVPDDVIEWLRYVQHQCPECEGESR